VGPERWSGPLVTLCVLAAITVVAFIAYGRGFVNVDAMNSLVWGHELASGELPDYANGPTPHPLSNLVAVILSPLGRHAQAGLLLISYASLAGFTYAVWRVASTLFGVAAGIVAVGLLLTRDVVSVNTALAYLDVPFAALVLAAVALEVQAPRRGTPVLAVLAVAGLIRPEAWLMSGLYWLWLLPVISRRDAAKTAVLVASAPAVWLLADLAVTGDLLYSLHGTTEAAKTVSNRASGVRAIFTDAPRTIGQAVRPSLVFAGLVGVGLVVWLRRRDGVGLLIITAAITVAFLLPVAGGTLVNARYAISTVALVCVFAGAAVGGWTREASRRPVWKIAAAVCLLALLVTAPSQVSRLQSTRENTTRITDTRAAAEHLIAGRLPCSPLVSPNGRLVALAAVWRNVDPSAIVDNSTHPTSKGTFVFGTPSAMEGVVVLPTRDAGKALARPPAAARAVRTRRGWTLYAACPS
jgi:hypothetical protein